MTTDAISHLRALAEAATLGPWHVYSTARVVSKTTYDIAVCNDATIAESGTDLDTKQAERNAAYIAIMHPETTLALLDRIAELEADAAQRERTALQ